MKCPFCGEKLQQTFSFNPKQFWCSNYYNHTHPINLQGTKELWQALIKMKKELDIRKKQVEIANKAFDFINTEWDNVDCSRKELGACAFNAKEDIAGWESDIETAEQKD